MLLQFFLPLDSETSIYSMQTYIKKLSQMQNKSIVSIQLLFLFNKVLEVIQSELGEFQYSFCSYSTNSRFLSHQRQISFNTASVLIQRDCNAISFVILQFQYSFCSYSTFKYLSSANPSFMFQYSFCSYSTDCTIFL